MLLIFLSILLNIAIASITGKVRNFIYNGNFTENICVHRYCVSESVNMVNGWIPSPQIQIGYGSLYNPNLAGNQRVLQLAASSNSCVRQNLKSIEVGLYELGFEYAARFDRPLADSQLEVYWNGKILKSFTPFDYNIEYETLSLGVSFEGRQNQVNFCAIGSKNQYGPVLKSVSLVKKSGNLILNSQFRENECAKNSCVSGSKNMVKGWIPDPQIQIGYGDIYNLNLQKQRVIELASTKKSCVKQNIMRLEVGVYQLGFQYAFRSERNFDDCEFQVFWNDRILKRLIPTNCKLAYDLLNITVILPGQDHELKFCSVGGKENNQYGAILRSVSLIKLTSELPISQPNLMEISMPKDDGVYLESHSEQCFEKQYFFKGDKIEINFIYNLISNKEFKDSAVFVTFDGEPVYRVLPNKNGQTIKITGQTTKGLHLVGFCPIGSPNQSSHQLVISNVNILAKNG